MPFGQIVIGPPGSGKSTYCYGMYQFLSAIGRKASIINLDPANDKLPYPVALDIRDYITLEEIMEEQQLGPNGGIMYAVEEIEELSDELTEQIRQLGKHEYLLIDCPGQVELFTHHGSLQAVFHKLQKQLDYRFCVVSLVDSYYITSPSQYISVLLLTLRSMLHFELPCVNVLSKIDLLSNYGKLEFNLDFYTEVQDLSYLQPAIEREQKSALGKKYAKLTEAIANVVSDFGLVSYEVLAIEDKQSMISLLSVIDKSNGYAFGTSEIGGDSIWTEVTRQGGYLNQAVDIQERWIDHKELYEQAREDRERQEMEEYKKANQPVDPEKEWEEALKKWEEEHNREIKR